MSSHDPDPESRAALRKRIAELEASVLAERAENSERQLDGLEQGDAIAALESERDELRADFEHEKRLLWAAKEQIAEQQLRIPTPGTLTRIERAEARVRKLVEALRRVCTVLEEQGCYCPEPEPGYEDAPLALCYGCRVEKAIGKDALRDLAGEGE